MTNNELKKKIGKVLENRYILEELIGIGGMSSVYKALDSNNNTEVAIKILNDEYLYNSDIQERFASECHSVAMLSHPNIRKIYDVSHSNSEEFIVMELVPGITLKQYADKKGFIPWKEVVHFSKQLASALSHAHSHGIIHKDIKLDNIMLMRDGTIKLTDFGIALIEDEIGVNSNIDIGSINYLAPEVAQGLQYSFQADIYSLGVVMYELLCHRKPFEADSVEQLVVQQSQAIQPISMFVGDIPSELTAIVYKAMQVNLDNRYISADLLQKDIEIFINKYKNDKQKIIQPETIKVEKIKKRDISKKEYLQRLKISGAISLKLGNFGLTFGIVIAFSFLWNFWLSDIFSPARRVVIPQFVNQNIESIQNNDSYNSIYNFTQENVVNTSVEPGTILEQNPASGRSIMINSKGIDVQLKVSTGFILTEVPDVKGLNYKEAKLNLEKMGFSVELNTITSDSVEKDFVIDSSPLAGEKISAGSTVYLDVSGGTEIIYVRMPNLIGLSESEAIDKLTMYDLVYGGSEKKHSDYDVGTVFGQSRVAHSEVQRFDSIIITVSNGPAGN